MIELEVSFAPLSSWQSLFGVACVLGLGGRVGHSASPFRPNKRVLHNSNCREILSVVCSHLDSQCLQTGVVSWTLANKRHTKVFYKYFWAALTLTRARKKTLSRVHEHYLLRSQNCSTKLFIINKSN